MDFNPYPTTDEKKQKHTQWNEMKDKGLKQETFFITQVWKDFLNQTKYK